jgi:hypothetical protein
LYPTKIKNIKRDDLCQGKHREIPEAHAQKTKLSEKLRTSYAEALVAPPNRGFDFTAEELRSTGKPLPTGTAG